MTPKFTPERHTRDLGERHRVDQITKERIRPPVAIARQFEANIDVKQLSPRPGRQLRVTEVGNGADADDVANGRFWFVAGYSLVGSLDVVPET
jgi:hypothetical protein